MMQLRKNACYGILRYRNAVQVQPVFRSFINKNDGANEEAGEVSEAEKLRLQKVEKIQEKQKLRTQNKGVKKVAVGDKKTDLKKNTRQDAVQIETKVQFKDVPESLDNFEVERKSLEKELGLQSGITEGDIHRILNKFDNEYDQQIQNILMSKQSKVDGTNVLKELKQKRQSIIKDLGLIDSEAANMKKVQEETQVLQDLDKTLLSELSQLSAVKGNEQSVQKLQDLQKKVKGHLDMFAVEKYQIMVQNHRNSLASLDSQFEKVQQALVEGKPWSQYLPQKVDLISGSYDAPSSLQQSLNAKRERKQAESAAVAQSIENAVRTKLEDKEGLYGEEYQRKNSWLSVSSEATKSRTAERLTSEIGELQTKLAATHNAINEVEVEQERASTDGHSQQVRSKLQAIEKQITEKARKLTESFERTRRRLNEKMAALASFETSNGLNSQLSKFQNEKNEIGEQLRKEIAYEKTTIDGKKASDLKSLIEKYQQMGNWTEKTINEFVREYSGIKAQSNISVVEDLEGVKAFANEWSTPTPSTEPESDFAQASKNLCQNSTQVNLSSKALKQLTNLSKTEMLKPSNAFQIRQWLRTLSLKGQSLNESGEQSINRYVNAYITSIGNPEYQQAVNQILNENLQLSKSSRFNAFVSDLAINTMDVSDSSSKDSIKIPVLDRFINLMLTLKNPNLTVQNQYARNQLAKELELVFNLRDQPKSQIYNLLDNPEFILKFQVVSLAKNHNFYGAMDQYMKEFSRICLETGDRNIVKNLERVLNSEVSMKLNKTQESKLHAYKNLPREIDAGVLAQPDFQFSPVGLKMQKIDNYLDLVKEQDRTREAISLIKSCTTDADKFRSLTDSFDQFSALLKELDKDQSNAEVRLGDGIGTFEKLKATTAYIDETIENAFLTRFGIRGINYANLEQVYNPLVSGLGTMQDVRNHLLKNGMTQQFTDLLATRYIIKLEEKDTSQISKVMDFFDTKRDKFSAMKALCDTQFNDVSLNYQILSNYNQELYQNQIHKNLSQQKKTQHQHQAVSRLGPIRPVQMRAFSSSNEEQKPGGFFSFLKGANKADEEAAQKAKQLEDARLAKEAQEKIKKAAAQQKLKSEEIEAAVVREEEEVSKDISQSLALENFGKNSIVEEAIKKYNIEFFKQFSFTGKDSLKLSQKGLEEFVVALENKEDVSQLLLSMIHQSYELNRYIPNIELLLYKMFCSPITSRNARKEETEDLLFGNIFGAKKMQMPIEVYESLLRTLTVQPKKKHYKKVVEYIRKYEPIDRVPTYIIDQIISVGINNKYPVTLGQYVRDFIVDGDYNIHKSSFMKFVKFMEQCKGFEEDAKKFYILTQQSSHLQIDYEMIKPMVVRIMKSKGGPDVMKFFEQLRKNILLNKSWDNREGKERHAELKRIRKEFYDGLIGDLMSFSAYTLSEIVMAEKLKEKFAVTINDELIGLNVYSAQTKFTEYREKFDILMDKESPYGFNKELGDQLGKTLMIFDTDEFKNDRLMLTDRIRQRMREEEIQYSGELFHTIIYVYTESQQWTEVSKILRQLTSPDQCQANIRTISYLKQNLVYCFQNNTRIDVQDAIDGFEARFFSYAQRKEAGQAIKQRKKKSETLEEDSEASMIDEKNLEVKQYDKKLMRREARKQIDDFMPETGKVLLKEERNAKSEGFYKQR